jgi:hypothetical protein
MKRVQLDVDAQHATAAIRFANSHLSYATRSVQLDFRLRF